jgi:predicted acyltransferase
MMFGVNAVAIYMSQSIIPWGRIVAIFTSPLAGMLGSLTPLVHAVTVLVVEWLILYWMYKRKVFLTA